MVHVEIITPERVAYEGDGILVTVPTVGGVLGVGGGHIPLLTNLKVGEVIVRRKEGDQHLAVAGGFVEILPDVVRIMADSAEHDTELDELVVKEALAAAERAKVQATDDTQFAHASAQLEHNLVRLKVAQRKHSRGGRPSISSEDNQ